MKTKTSIKKQAAARFRRSKSLVVAALIMMGVLMALPAGQASHGIGVLRAEGVAAGTWHTCVHQTGGDVDCYGRNDDGQAADYRGGDATAVAAGGSHTCVLRGGGNVDCYGSNSYGQAADYTRGDAVAVSAGTSHTCVLRGGGNVDCYGSNSYDQAADYTGGDAVAVSAGGIHTCVLKVGGNVDCWGSNGYYNDGRAADYTGGDATAVAAGGFHTCVLKIGGNVGCWGGNNYGESAAYTGGDATAVAAGSGYTCVLRGGGNVDCWGYNAWDYTGGDATAVAAGGAHTCVVQSVGNVHCWGNNNYDQREDWDIGLYSGSDSGDTRLLLHKQNIPVVPSQPLPPTSLPGQEVPDYPGTDPVATDDVGPVQTPPVGQDVGSLIVYDEGANVCIDFVAEGGSSQPVACVARALLGPADGLVQRGETELLVVDPEDPFVDGDDVPDVPGTDPVPTDDVEETEEGEHGSTPEITVDVAAGYHYSKDHLFQAATLLDTAEAWMPFAPGDESWFLGSGDDVNLFVTVTVYQDGQEVETIPLSVPFVGQALATAEATAGAL